VNASILLQLQLRGVYWSYQAVGRAGSVGKSCVATSSHSFQVIKMKLATHGPYAE